MQLNCHLKTYFGFEAAEAGLEHKARNNDLFCTRMEIPVSKKIPKATP